MSAKDLILLVDDNSADATSVELAFKKLPGRFALRWVSSGAHAIDYLAGRSIFHDRKVFPLPKLVLLDLVMPGMDGFEVLEWIEAQPELKGLPVVVLAGSPTSPMIGRAYNSGATSFIAKPPSLEALVEELRNVLEYWVPTPGVVPMNPGPPPGLENPDSDPITRLAG